MAENTGLFVKVWVSMLDDDWFISLNCTERGLWCQLLIYAKRMGDSGMMSWRSWGHLSHNLGLTSSKTSRFCKGFAKDGKLKIKQNNKQKGYVIEIIIPNYQHYQQLKGGQNLVKNDIKIERLGSKPDPQDKNRIDKNRIDNISSVSFFKIIEDLNTKAQKNYATDPKKSSKAYELVVARMKEGFTVDDFYNVHAIKSAQWRDDEKMNSYLRPNTLYRLSHFAQYLGEYVPVDARPQTKSSKYAQELRKKVLGEDYK